MKCICGCKELYHGKNYPHRCFNSPACGCKAWQTPKANPTQVRSVVMECQVCGLDLGSFDRMVDRTLHMEECK